MSWACGSVGVFDGACVGACTHTVRGAAAGGGSGGGGGGLVIAVAMVLLDVDWQARARLQGRAG